MGMRTARFRFDSMCRLSRVRKSVRLNSRKKKWKIKNISRVINLKTLFLLFYFHPTPYGTYYGLLCIVDFATKFSTISTNVACAWIILGLLASFFLLLVRSHQVCLKIRKNIPSCALYKHLLLLLMLHSSLQRTENINFLISFSTYFLFSSPHSSAL